MRVQKTLAMAEKDMTVVAGPGTSKKIGTTEEPMVHRLRTTAGY